MDNLEERTKHLIEMETKMDEVIEKEKDLDQAISALEALPDLLAPLDQWLDSGQWLEDFRLDEQHAFGDLPRGSLSEDGLYNLQMSLVEKAQELEALCRTFLRSRNFSD